MRRTVRGVTLAASVSALLIVSGCSGNAGQESEGGEDGSSQNAGEDATRTVETGQGEVEIPEDPQRIVVLNYSLAGYLFNLDAPVVATTSRDFDYEGTFPDEWSDKAESEGTEWLPWSADGFDLEAVLDAEPDLIIGGGLGFPNGLAVDAYDELSRIAPTVIVDGELDPWQEQLEFLAVDVFDDQQTYDSLVAAYQERRDEVSENITPPEGEVAYVSFTADESPYVIIEDQGLPVALEEVGIEAAPLFEEGDFEPYAQAGDMFPLSSEEVGETLTQPTLFVMGFNADTTDVETLSENPVYSSLPAFENDQAYDLPYWALRSNYDEAMNTLDVIEETFN